MGLDVGIGILCGLRNNAQGMAYVRERFATVNGFLASLGLPVHEEPADVQKFAFQLGSARNMARLQRYAALVRAGTDPWVAGTSGGEVARSEYASSVKLNMDAKIGAALLKSPPAPGPSFDHLVVHSSDDLYLPVTCNEVLIGVAKGTKVAHVVGFSGQLREECEILAQSLRLPLDIDPDGDALWKALDASDPNADDWRRFGAESFVCARLLRMATLSVERRSAIVFR